MLRMMFPSCFSKSRNFHVQSTVCGCALGLAVSPCWLADSSIFWHQSNAHLIVLFEVPGKFYKRSQEKNSFPAAGFFLAVQPTPWSRMVLVFRSRISGRCCVRAALMVFSASGFHRLGATKPVRSETNQAARLSGANHGSIGDSWPIAFSGCPRGTRVA